MVGEPTQGTNLIKKQTKAPVPLFRFVYGNKTSVIFIFVLKAFLFICLCSYELCKSLCPPISDILDDNPQQMILRDGFIFENK